MSEVGCKYVVVRYIPDRVRNEPRNIGIIVQVPETGVVIERFASDLRSRLAGVSSPTDRALVYRYLEDFRAQYAGLREGQTYLQQTLPPSLEPDYLGKLSREGFGVLQFSEPRGVLTENPRKEADFLFDTFVGGQQGLVGESVRRSRLKTELRREFMRRRVLTPGTRKIRRQEPKALEQNVTLRSGFSRVPYTVDFAYQDGKVLVIETIDLRKSPRQSEHETFESAFKLEDLSRGLNRRFIGCAVVAPPPSESKLTNQLARLLRAYSDVFVYSRDRDRRRLFEVVQDCVGVESTTRDLFRGHR